MGDPKLFEEFSKVSANEWKQKIVAELQGADFEETLVWQSPEGIKVRPFYNSQDLDEVQEFPISKKGIWKICQLICVEDAEEANSRVLDTLSRGAESIFFSVPSENIGIEKLLNDIDADIPLYFDFGFLSPFYLKKIQNTTQKTQLNLDCIGHLARTGNWFSNEEDDFEILKALQDDRQKSVVAIDTSLYQNAGANIVQQLAYALAHVNEYFVKELVSGTITLKVSVGTNYFFEIAKLRALRWLYASLAEEYGLQPDCHIITQPTQRNKTIYDYNSNMLRTTTESMAAILGGADTVCNLPYDSIYHKPNEFGDRIARNQLLLLKNESYFSEASNPADGTYYIESLTQELAESALQKFKDIEAKGGFLKLLKEGIIQKEIAESAQNQREKFDKEEIVLVGSNAYQNPEDRMKDNLELNPFEINKIEQTAIEPIIEKRLSSTLEQKRLNDE